MKKFVLPSLALSLLCITLVVLSFALYCVTVPGYSQSGTMNVEIPQGSSLNKIALLLEQKKVLRGGLRFKMLAKLMKVERGLKFGEYQFTLPLTPRALLAKLARGDVIAYLITFPEGDTLFDVAQHIEESGLCSGAALLGKARDPHLIQSLRLEGESLEGYLFPDTYKFNKGSSAEIILKRMVDQFNRHFNQDMAQQAARQGLSKKQVITIASLIEKETGYAQEKPLIAAVFFNRLKKGMRLDCDPTVIYSVRRENPAFNGPLNKQQLKIMSLYNTYLNVGLPPGPICNPGLDSIQAALNPAAVKYLYFVSKNDGTHQFSETLGEHNRAVARYQRMN